MVRFGADVVRLVKLLVQQCCLSLAAFGCCCTCSAGGSFFIDEDPAIFHLLLQFLTYCTSSSHGTNTNPLMVASASAAHMQPSQYFAALPAALHGMLKVAADRLGMTELAKLLTPPENIVEHLMPW